MKLVLDSNVLISALMKDSVSREILLLPFLEFLLPEYALEEIKKHKDLISQRSALRDDEIDVILGLLLNSITVVPSSKIRKFLSQAKKAIGHIDERDIPFVALAYSMPNDGIWTNDKHFDKLKGIPIWKTNKLFQYLQKPPKQLI